MSSSTSPADLAAIAAELAAHPDETVTAALILRRLIELVPDAEQASLTVRSRQTFSTMASTGAMAAEADTLQYSFDEGPCVMATTNSAWVRSGDVGRDPRWPQWGPRARDLGVGALLSIGLVDQQKRLQGALNMYSRISGVFESHDVVVLALVYAVHAATALSNARLIGNLQTALDSRHTIGMAQGLLMERFGLDQTRSFELLRRVSSTEGRKLRDVAAEVVETRTLPGHESIGG